MNSSICRIDDNSLVSRPSKNPRHAVFSQAYTASSATDDDDDETFGGEYKQAYGMRLPNLSPEDKEYLDAATSDKDFMRRMVEIAHRMDQRRHVDTLTSGRQTPDQYVEGLTGVAKERAEQKQSPSQSAHISPLPPPSPPPPPPSASQFSAQKASPAPHVESDSVEDIDAQIAELNRQLVEANDFDVVSADDTADDTAGEFDSNHLVNDNLDDLEVQIQRLNENIKQVINDSDAKSSASADDDSIDAGNHWDDVTQETDSQKRLEKIQKKLADAVEKGAGVPFTPTEPAPSMSAEDRKKSFDESDALRRKIRKEMGADDDSDDMNTDDRTSSLERQIAAVQREMEKLKMEDDAEEVTREYLKDDLSGDWDESADYEKSDSDVKLKASRLLAELERKKSVDSTSDPVDAKPEEPRYEGLENTPGQMSAEEKMKAFEMLRKQVMGGNKERLYDDPYNTVLPEKRERSVESRDEMDEDEGGDEPTGDEDEFDSFGPIAGDAKQLVEELEGETKKYITESRRLLQEHEVKMNVLLSRLMLSFEE